MGVTASDEFTWYQCKSQADAEAYKNGTKLKGAPTDAGYYYVVTSFKTASGQTLEGKKSFEQVLQITDLLNCPHPQYVQSMTGLVRYMIHMDNPEKHQYSRDRHPPCGGCGLK